MFASLTEELAFFRFLFGIAGLIILFMTVALGLVLRRYVAAMAEITLLKDSLNNRDNDNIRLRQLLYQANKAFDQYMGVD